MNYGLGSFCLLLLLLDLLDPSNAKEIEVTPKPSLPDKLPQKPIIVAPIMVKPPEMQPRSIVYRNGYVPPPMNFPGSLMPLPSFRPPNQFHRSLVTAIPNVASPSIPMQNFNPSIPTAGLPFVSPALNQRAQNGSPNRMLGQDSVNMTPFHGANGASLAASLSATNSNPSPPVDKLIEINNLKASDKLARFEKMTHKLEDLSHTIELVNKNIDEVDSRLKDNFRNLDIDIQKIEVLKRDGRYQKYV